MEVWGIINGEIYDSYQIEETLYQDYYKALLFFEQAKKELYNSLVGAGSNIETLGWEEESEGYAKYNFYYIKLKKFKVS